MQTKRHPPSHRSFTEPIQNLWPIVPPGGLGVTYKYAASDRRGPLTVLAAAGAERPSPPDLSTRRALGNRAGGRKKRRTILQPSSRQALTPGPSPERRKETFPTLSVLLLRTGQSQLAAESANLFGDDQRHLLLHQVRAVEPTVRLLIDEVTLDQYGVGRVQEPGDLAVSAAVGPGSTGPRWISACSLRSSDRHWLG